MNFVVLLIVVFICKSESNIESDTENKRIMMLKNNEDFIAQAINDIIMTAAKIGCDKLELIVSGK